MYIVRQCTAQISRTLRIGQVLQKRCSSSTLKSSNSKDLKDSSAMAEGQSKDPAPEQGENHEAGNTATDEDESDMVEMWNKEAVAGPEWNGPRGYEPTKYGDWSSKGRVTDF